MLLEASPRKDRRASFAFATAIVLLLLSALALSGRSDGPLPVRIIRWFLGLDEAEEFAIQLRPADGARSP